MSFLRKRKKRPKFAPEVEAALVKHPKKSKVTQLVSHWLNPVAYQLSYQLPCSCFFVLNSAGAGNPEWTDWYRSMAADAELRIKENGPEVPNAILPALFDFKQSTYMIIPFLNPD
jgi:hypothetical protein